MAASAADNEQREMYIRKKGDHKPDEVKAFEDQLRSMMKE